MKEDNDDVLNAMLKNISRTYAGESSTEKFYKSLVTQIQEEKQRENENNIKNIPMSDNACSYRNRWLRRSVSEKV